MKIAVLLTIEVDPVEWATEHGIDMDRPAVRRDIKRYVLDQVQNSDALNLAYATVTLR